jgi:hypothetical protein
VTIAARRAENNDWKRPCRLGFVRRTRGRFQVTIDGSSAYKKNIPFAFGMQVDFAQLIKNYGDPRDHAVLAGQDSQH